MHTHVNRRVRLFDSIHSRPPVPLPFFIPPPYMLPFFSVFFHYTHIVFSICILFWYLSCLPYVLLSLFFCSCSSSSWCCCCCTFRQKLSLPHGCGAYKRKHTHTIYVYTNGNPPRWQRCRETPIGKCIFLFVAYVAAFVHS